MTHAIAIETSGRVGSVAVVLGDVVVGMEIFPHGLQNAAGVVPMMDRLVRGRGWLPGDVDYLYVSGGPGSFTGLRIGITLAKTYALATGVKIVAVPTSRVLVENAPSNAHEVVIVLDAKRGQIFTARFERTTDGWNETEPSHLDTLSAMLSRSKAGVCLLGEGIPYHQDAISNSDQSIMMTDETHWRARAEMVAKIGAQMAKRGQFADPLTLNPIYVRLPEAEEKRLIAEGKM